MTRFVRFPHQIRLVAALAAASTLTLSDRSHALPPGFVDQLVVDGLNQVSGVCFAPDGRGFLWEKAGRVWILRDGVLSDQPLIDISDEVGNWKDHGLLGFALDPNFLQNGRIYLLYAVDFHHLRYAGTPEYDPQANEYERDTIARLTRYTCSDPAGTPVVDPASRRVLVGETISTGFPITHESHSIGTLIFGEDGTLLAGNGDGSTWTHPDGGGFRPGSSNTALEDGVISPEENVGAFRAQLPSSLSGKIIRIDPETGDGVPSNPFYDPAAPRSARSRLWSMGLRNPFRFTLRPGTGSPDPAAADPGTLYIGDVGWNSREELNIAPGGGMNFGWPLFEGVDYQPGYFALQAANLLAPNPLAGQPGCPYPHFRFRDLIVQATLGIPRWPNPCNPSLNIPISIPRFVHARPVLEWGHDGPARVAVFNGMTPAAIELGAEGCPVQGEQFGGRTSIGGVWYTHTAFPPPWRNVYYHGDFLNQWIKAMVFDESDQLLEIRTLAEPVGAIVCMAVHPIDGGLYYIAYSQTGAARLRRIVYAGDTPPVAAASAQPAYGPLPLQVQFSSAGSEWVGTGTISYLWDFGDATPPSRQANPTHVYTGELDVTAAGEIVARVYEFNPPFPVGPGAPDPAVIRDRDWPLAGDIGAESGRTFDTRHGGAQGDDDWIGYTFATPLVLSRLTFQEGRHAPDGGWFETLGVEYFDGAAWRPVQALQISPPYSGNNGVDFEVFSMTFTPVEARGLRLRGVPGGSQRYISVAELRVGGVPPELGAGPRRHDVVLTVTNTAGVSASAQVSVWPNNSPPQAVIDSPLDGGYFRVVAPTDIRLSATVFDAEHAPEQCECVWTVLARRDGGASIQAAVEGCDAEYRIEPAGAGCDGEPFSYEFSLTVTDGHGLSSSASASLYPNCCRPDWNNDLAVNSADISEFLTSWLESFSGGPAADFDGDGQTNSSDVSAFLAAWLRAVNIGC